MNKQSKSVRRVLKRIFWSSGLMLLSFAFFTVAILGGFYIGSGRDYQEDYKFFKDYVLNEPVSIVIGEVYPVTHKEAYLFVLKDKTNENEYEEGYNCVDFALELWRNANWNQIECSLIGLDQEHGRSHMIVGFPDEDGNLLLVDPQTDTIMHPVVGEYGFLSVYEVTFIGVPLEVERWPKE